VGAILPGVPQDALAVAFVLLGWLTARAVGDRLPLTLRLAIILAGATVAVFILAPQIN